MRTSKAILEEMAYDLYSIENKSPMINVEFITELKNGNPEVSHYLDKAHAKYREEITDRINEGNL